MTTIEAFGQFRPFTIGFDSIFDKLSEAAVPHNGGINIPYNIIKRSEDSWFIEMRCGFNKKNVDIELKENNLTITCSKKNETPQKMQLSLFTRHCRKKLYKTFALAEHVEVKGAEIVDGILSIELIRNIPEKENLKLLKSNNFFVVKGEISLDFF